MYVVLKCSGTEVWSQIYLQNEQGHFVMRFMYETAYNNNE